MRHVYHWLHSLTNICNQWSEIQLLLILVGVTALITFILTLSGRKAV